MLVDQRSMAYILLWYTFKQLDILVSTLQQHDDPLFGFSCERVGMRGSIELITRFNTKKDGYKYVVVKHLVIHANHLLYLFAWSAINQHYRSYYVHPASRLEVPNQ